jgi:hypothetical protein
MEEDSDTNRDSVDGALELFEAPNTDVARAAGRVGSYSASFSGVDGTYLYLPRGGALGNNFTVAMWLYPTSASTEQIVLSVDEATKHGPYLSVVPSAGALKVKGVAYYGDGQGDVSITSTSTMTLNAWHLVVWGLRNDPIFGTQTMYVQIDSGVTYSVALTYWLASSGNDLIIGQRKGASAGVGYTMPYSGRVDQLTFSSRYWDTVDVSEFYNAGGGKAYPFVESSYDSLNAGVVAYWEMDEASNTTRDDSINQNDAADPTAQVAQSTSTYKLGAASAYRTTNGSRLSVTSNSSIEYSGDFTVGGWAYITAWSDGSGFAFVVKENHTTSKAEWGISAQGSGNVGFRVAGSDGWYSVTKCQTTGQAVPSLNAWHFWVAEYTASTKTCKLQIDNGTGQTGTGTTVPAVQTNVPLTFGGENSGANGMSAYFDGWFLYKRVLTTQQKTDLYNSGSGRTYPF